MQLLSQNTLETFSLQTIFQFLIIIFAFNLILFNQPLRCLLGLTGVYILTSLLFIYMNSTFLGILYLTVYIGAVVVLFLFVIMIIGDDGASLTNVAQRNNSIDVNLLTGFILFAVIYENIQTIIKFVSQSLQASDIRFWDTFSLNTSNNKISIVLDTYSYVPSIFDQFVRFPILVDINSVSELRQIGFVLYGTDNGILIILVSFVLLVGMLGAIVLTTSAAISRRWSI